MSTESKIADCYFDLNLDLLLANMMRSQIVWLVIGVRMEMQTDFKWYLS